MYLIIWHSTLRRNRILWLLLWKLPYKQLNCFTFMDEANCNIIFGWFYPFLSFLILLIFSLNRQSQELKQNPLQHLLGQIWIQIMLLLLPSLSIWKPSGYALFLSIIVLLNFAFLNLLTWYLCCNLQVHNISHGILYNQNRYYYLLTNSTVLKPKWK